MNFHLRYGAIFIMFFNISCSEGFDSNEKLLGLSIGDTKEQVLTRLNDNASVTHIRPDVTHQFVVKANSGKIDSSISKMLKAPGIVIEGESPKLQIKLTFKDDHIASVYLAPVNKNEDLRMKVGMTREEVARALIDHLVNRKVDRIFNYMPESDWIDVKNISENEKDILFSADVWLFNEIDKHSYIKIHFSDGVLSSIDYKWTPIELP